MGSSGPKHNPIYKISVCSITGTKQFIGIGGSNKAEQNAAAKFIKR